jgi:hypothetical protein
MSRPPLLSFPLLLLSFVAWPAGPSSAGDASKPARGNVTAVAGDSVMINLANDMDVTFRVDAKTRIVARGAGTRMRQAKADGASGLKLAEVLPIGGAVEVTYEEINGRRCARSIRVTYQDNAPTMYAETVRLVSRATRSTR